MGKTIRQARLGQPGQGGDKRGEHFDGNNCKISSWTTNESAKHFSKFPRNFPSFSLPDLGFSSADFGATCRWNDRERKLRSAAVGDVGNGQARRHRTEFMGAVWVYRVGACRLSELGGCRSLAVAWSWQGRGWWCEGKWMGLVQRGRALRGIAILGLRGWPGCAGGMALCLWFGT